LIAAVSPAALLKFVAYMPLGRLAISDHAMTAKDEIHALAEEFQKQRNQSLKHPTGLI